jgi:hypothetical protein
MKHRKPYLDLIPISSRRRSRSRAPRLLQPDLSFASYPAIKFCAPDLPVPHQVVLSRGSLTNNDPVYPSFEPLNWVLNQLAVGGRRRMMGRCHTCFSEENQVQTYMHARIKCHAYSWHKWITETISRKKKGDYQRFTLNPGNEGTKLHKQSTGGYVCLELHHTFTSSSCSFLFLSNIVYSKGEHLSYSASVGKGWMQRLYSGLGYKHLAF